MYDPPTYPTAPIGIRKRVPDPSTRSRRPRIGMGLLCVAFLCLPCFAGRSFNGTSDFITVTNASPIDITGQQITLSAWCQFAVVPTTEQECMSKADAGNTQYEIYINAAGQPAKTLGIYIHQSTPLNHDFYINCGSQAVAAPAWNVITVTWNSTGTNYGGFIYCQGVYVTNGFPPSGADILSDADNLLFGKKAATSPTFCACSVAEVAIWNTALSSGQAIALGHACPVGFSARRAGLPPPQGYWPLAGASGSSPEPDLSGNKQNGTLTGTTPSNHAPCTP